MNWSLYFDKLMFVYLHCLAVVGSYYFCKTFIEIVRKNKEESASTAEKIWIYICAFFIIVVISSLFAKDDITNFAVYFTAVFISSILGLIEAFKKDAKLTSSERWEIKRDVDNLRDDSQM